MSLIFCLLDCFAVYSTAVTGVCYVRPIKTIWAAAGTAEAAMYDPKSGENVSQWYNSIICFWTAQSNYTWYFEWFCEASKIQEKVQSHLKSSKFKVALLLKNELSYTICDFQMKNGVTWFTSELH